MSFWFPLIAQAQQTTNPTIKAVVFKISEIIINPLITLGFVVAILYFMWGVIEYIRDRNSGHLWEASAFGGSGEGAKSADKIVHGLIGLFIMVSAFGILNLLKSLIGSDIATP